MSRLMARHLYGLVDVLILKTISVHGPQHGLAVLDRIRTGSDDFLQIEDAALYPALHRLHKEGLLEAEWRVSDKGRQARYYSLTRRGKRELERAVRIWERHTLAVSRILQVSLEELS